MKKSTEKMETFKGIIHWKLFVIFVVKDKCATVIWGKPLEPWYALKDTTSSLFEDISYMDDL